MLEKVLIIIYIKLKWYFKSENSKTRCYQDNGFKWAHLIIKIHYYVFYHAFLWWVILCCNVMIIMWISCGRWIDLDRPEYIQTIDIMQYLCLIQSTYLRTYIFQFISFETLNVNLLCISQISCFARISNVAVT